MKIVYHLELQTKQNALVSWGKCAVVLCKAIDRCIVRGSLWVHRGEQWPSSVLQHNKPMQRYRIEVNTIPPTIDTLFATSLPVVRSHCATCLESVRWQRDHGKTTGIVCNGVLACLDVLSDGDSEQEVDIEDSLSWDESDPSPKKCQIATVK